MNDKKITVFGTWHLGCVTAACLAELGYEVVGTDFDEEIVNKLSHGHPPIFEPGLENLIKKNIKKKNLIFCFDKKVALNRADVIFITFDTKIDEEDRVDLGDIYKAVDEIIKYAKSSSIIIISSQVPTGTCSKIREHILKKNKTLKFDICYMPENLRLGSAINSFLKPDRIVIGANDENTLKRVKKLCQPLKCEIVTMSTESAEMTKHALNAYLATCVSFINEISDLCEICNASASDVVKALKLDRRVSPYAPINPGLGFSGGTLARDIQILREIGDLNKFDTKLLDAVKEVNDNRKHFIFNRINRLFGHVTSIQIGILGLTYKPGTNTLRRSLSLEVARELLSYGAIVKAFDPKVRSQVPELPELKVCKNVNEVAKNSDVLVLITEWPEFKKLQLERIKALMKKPIFIDTKNFLNPKNFRKLHFRYIGIGEKHEA
ncbi:MAG: nucleotide sugar dehydrogenase [Candidatus Thermoplasmatota archaeon]|nr:nucleotide sugar dehydrogenase [Candidatus Thermoplasmatota archaeon]